jgi:diamine N-acetyltransferase
MVVCNLFCRKMVKKHGCFRGKLQFCYLMKTEKKIFLRAPEPADVDFLFDLENDRKLWHVSQTWVPYSRFELEQYIFSAGRQEPFAAGQVRFIIGLSADETAIGTADLFALDAVNRRGGVGMVLLEAYRGKWLAGKALDLLMDYAFNLLNLHQLYCNIEKGNEASLRLFQSRHFTITGVKKEWNFTHGNWHDELFLQHIVND